MLLKVGSCIREECNQTGVGPRIFYRTGEAEAWLSCQSRQRSISFWARTNLWSRIWISKGKSRKSATTVVCTESLDSILKHYWMHHPAQQSKLFISLNWADTRLSAEIITGLCHLNKHLTNVGVINDPLSRLCLEEEQNFTYYNTTRRLSVVREPYWGQKKWTRSSTAAKGIKLHEGNRTPAVEITHRQDKLRKTEIFCPFTWYFAWIWAGFFDGTLE